MNVIMVSQELGYRKRMVCVYNDARYTYKYYDSKEYAWGSPIEPALRGEGCTFFLKLIRE